MDRIPVVVESKQIPPYQLSHYLASNEVIRPLWFQPKCTVKLWECLGSRLIRIIPAKNFGLGYRRRIAYFICQCLSVALPRLVTQTIYSTKPGIIWCFGGMTIRVPTRIVYFVFSECKCY